MKFFCFLLIYICHFHFAEAKVHLSRQWSRSTLVNPYLEFRNPHRMTPVLTENLVIQGNGTNGIKAFERRSGNQVWSMALQNGVEGGAALDEDKLYFGSNNGKFYCLEVASGKVLWTIELNSESLTRPTVFGPHVFHVTGNNTLYALDKTNGQTLWVKTNAAKSNMTVRGQTAPVYDQGVLYLGFSDGSFSAINAQNGRELWSKRIGDDKKFNDVDATAVITQNCLLVASYANSLYCLDKSNGAIRWRHDVGGFHAVTVDGDRIFYPTGDGEIHILDSASGKLLKKIVKLKGLATTINILGEYLIYGESEGALVVRNKTNLNQVAEFFPGLGLFAKPQVDVKSAQIYFVSNDANLFRMDLTNRPENPFLWSEKQ